MTEKRALRIGVAGPVGSGKTALVHNLSRELSTRYEVAVVTNDIYTREDADFLARQGVLELARIRGVETGGCPHAAIRDDASMNLEAIIELEASLPGLELILVESGGNNLAAAFSPELVDVWFYVIDVSAGDKIPRKGGPGIMRSDLLIINKIDLAPHVGASLEVMARDAKKMRKDKPFVFSNLKDGTGLPSIIEWITMLLDTPQEQREVQWDGRLAFSGPREYLTHAGLHGHSHTKMIDALLPAQYQSNNGASVSAMPMSAAELQYDANGQVAWDQIWTSFCDLALAGGPSHRGELLEPVMPDVVEANMDAYANVISELSRGIRMVADVEVESTRYPGWIGIVCDSEEMALWLLRAIVVENISVRREEATLYLPAGPHFQLENEIKSIITVVAKTHHYWLEHVSTVDR